MTDVGLPSPLHLDRHHPAAMLKRILVPNSLHKRRKSQVLLNQNDDLSLVEQAPPSPPLEQRKPAIPFIEWPRHVIINIMSCLDEITLLNLSITCKYLNELGMAHYWVAARVTLQPGGYLYLGENTSGIYQSKAIRLTLGGASAITHLNFLAKPGYERFESDMVELASAVRYTPKLRSFVLDLGGLLGRRGGYGVDPWFDVKENLAALPAEKAGLAWLVKAYTDLVDAVARTGCNTVALIGGDTIPSQLFSEKRRRYAATQGTYSHFLF